MTAGIWFWILYVISLLFGGGWYWRTPAAQPFGPYAGRWSRGPSSVVRWSGSGPQLRDRRINLGAAPLQQRQQFGYDAGRGQSLARAPSSHRAAIDAERVGQRLMPRGAVSDAGIAYEHGAAIGRWSVCHCGTIARA